MPTPKHSIPTQPTDNWYLAILADEARAVAQFQSAQNPEAYARMLVRRVQARCQGQQIRVPRRTAAQRQAMEQDISTRYNGRNGADLAAEYQIDIRHVRRIANRLRR